MPKYIAIDRNTREIRAASSDLCALIRTAPADCFITVRESREYFDAWFAPGFWKEAA